MSFNLLYTLLVFLHYKGCSNKHVRGSTRCVTIHEHFGKVCLVLIGLFDLVMLGLYLDYFGKV